MGRSRCRTSFTRPKCGPPCRVRQAGRKFKPPGDGQGAAHPLPHPGTAASAVLDDASSRDSFHCGATWLIACSSSISSATRCPRGAAGRQRRCRRPLPPQRDCVSRSLSPTACAAGSGDPYGAARDAVSIMLALNEPAPRPVVCAALDPTLAAQCADATSPGGSGCAGFMPFGIPFSSYGGAPAIGNAAFARHMIPQSFGIHVLW